MRLQPLILCGTLIIILSLTNLVGAADELALKQQQYSRKLDQLTQTNTGLNGAETDYQQALAQYEAVHKIIREQQNAYDQAKADYDRASQNIDLVSSAKLAELARVYQAAVKELKATLEEQQQAENEKTYRETILNNFQTQQTQQEKDLLTLTADIFDLNLRRPIWVEGFGESILDENTTMKDCEQRALDAALRDASEKGGKAVIESVTQVEMFQVLKDRIKQTIKVQVLEQDNSGDYGQVKRVIDGDIIKYQARVRVKVRSIDTYNPYREQLQGMEGKPAVTAITTNPPISDLWAREK